MKRSYVMVKPLSADEAGVESWQTGRDGKHLILMENKQLKFCVSTLFEVNDSRVTVRWVKFEISFIKI